MTEIPSNLVVPQLRTKRTIMRGPCIADFADSAKMWADKNVVRYISAKPSGEAQSWSRILRYIGHWHALHYGYWVVEDIKTGAFLGEVGFADFKRNLNSSLIGIPEVGWVFASHAQGRGLATETVMAALRWGDNNLSTKNTFCIVDPEHSVSIRVAEKTGYKKQEIITYNNQPTLLMERIAIK